MDAFEILVLILSILLGIFLVLSIVVVSMAVALVRALRQMVTKGEQLVDAAEKLSETLKRNAGATVILKTLLSFVTKVANKKK